MSIFEKITGRRKAPKNRAPAVELPQSEDVLGSMPERALPPTAARRLAALLTLAVSAQNAMHGAAAAATKVHEDVQHWTGVLANQPRNDRGDPVYPGPYREAQARLHAAQRAARRVVPAVDPGITVGVYNGCCRWLRRADELREVNVTPPGAIGPEWDALHLAREERLAIQTSVEPIDTVRKRAHEQLARLAAHGRPSVGIVVEDALAAPS